MVWVKLDDGFAEHPKVLRLSAWAFRLHIEMLCYCGRQLTDGAIPAEQLRGRKPKHVQELVDAGLWDVSGCDYTIHDFLEYNKSREQVEADRKRAAERQAKLRRKSQGK